MINKSILAASAILISSIASLAQNKKEISLSDIWQTGVFRADYVRGLRSMKDGLHYTSVESDRGGQKQVNKYAYESGALVETLFSSSDLNHNHKLAPAGLVFDSYTFSSDEKKVLLTAETERIYRHSTRELCYVYDLETKKLKKLSDEKYRFATFSPDGDKVAYVSKNNLFVLDLESDEKIQITTDGEPNMIINGATDWVYEEEFAFDKAFFWSPSGNKISYFRFEEATVKEFNITYYRGGLYPEEYKFHYPKAGEGNSIVSVMLYDIPSKKNIEVNLSEEYKARIKWSRSDEFFTVTTLNRHQNELKLYKVNTVDGSTSILLEEKNDTYIDIHDNLYFFEGNKKFIWTTEIGGFNHVYLYSGAKKSQITQGEWEVSQMYGVDEKSGFIYFQAAKESPMQREIYSVKINGSGLKKLSSNPGTNSAAFSNGFKYFINTQSSANNPAVINLKKGDGTLIRTLKNNSGLKQVLGQYKISNQEFFSFKTSENVELNAWMIKPTDFNPTKKYPVLMFVYGGPGSQTVKDSWGGANYLWYQTLANKGYIIVSVDNRGTGGRGELFKKMTYLQLGKYETMDQIEGAKYLQKQPYVDGNRIGIWGWSYGGYMSSLCLFKGADIFKMAIAVAPVTNWKFYDSIYTERYMQTPDENSGYDENSPITHVGKLKGKYLLIHGTADDNVHFQNSVEMVAALQKENKQFDLMIYPDRNHGIYGGNTRIHLYTKMTNYILDNL